MTKENQDIIQKKVIEQKSFELPEGFLLESIESSKPTPSPKPQRLKTGHNNAKAFSSSNQEQNIDITTQATEQECDKTFAEKKDFFEQLSNGCKSKGKVANRVEQINQNGLSSNTESKCKMINIEEVQQVCGRER